MASTFVFTIFSRINECHSPTWEGTIGLLQILIDNDIDVQFHEVMKTTIREDDFLTHDNVVQILANFDGVNLEAFDPVNGAVHFLRESINVGNLLNVQAFDKKYLQTCRVCSQERIS